jgi:ABC-type polysaccharide/polyol phosphate export permease
MPPFDRRLVCAEENDVLEELRRRDVAMRYEPELGSYHERRPTWRSFADQMHIYGRGRGQLLFFRPRAAPLAVLAPSAFVLYLIAAVPLAILSPLALAPLLAYLVVVGAVAGRVGWSLGKPAAVPVAAGLTATVHLCYGVGVLRGWAAEVYRSLWNYVRLLAVLTGRQLRIRSKRSLVGVVWPIVGPAFLLVLYMFVFNHIFRQPIPHYAVYLVAGLLPWTFLAQTLGTAVVSLSTESELILQARFPYELLPLGAVTAMSAYFLVSMTGFLVYLGVSGQLVLHLLPAIIVPLASIYLFVAALATVLAFVDIYNRDLRQVLANLLTVWFFLVPIVYSQARLGSSLKLLQSFDPINMIIGEFRDVLYYGHLSRPAHIGELLSVCIGTFLLVVIMFRRASQRIPKEI